MLAVRCEGFEGFLAFLYRRSMAPMRSTLWLEIPIKVWKHTLLSGSPKNWYSFLPEMNGCPVSLEHAIKRIASCSRFPWASKTSRNDFTACTVNCLKHVPSAHLHLLASMLAIRSWNKNGPLVDLWSGLSGLQWFFRDSTCVRTKVSKTKDTDFSITKNLHCFGATLKLHSSKFGASIFWQLLRLLPSLSCCSTVSFCSLVLNLHWQPLRSVPWGNL